MASYAFSTVSISIHSWVCGSRSWLTISILSPEIRIDEIVAIVGRPDETIEDFHINREERRTEGQGTSEARCLPFKLRERLSPGLHQGEGVGFVSGSTAVVPGRRLFRGCFTLRICASSASATAMDNIFICVNRVQREWVAIAPMSAFLRNVAPHTV